MGAAGANLRILARNLIDEITPTSTGTSFLASLPVTNVGLPTQRSQSARTTAAGSPNLRASFASAQRVNMMAVTRHNFTTAATMAPTYYSDNAFVTAVYAPGASTAFSTAGMSVIDQAFYRSTDAAGLRTSVAYSALFTNVQSLQCALSDAANPDGFNDITRWWAGEYFELTYDPMFGDAVSLTYDDASVQGRSDDGTMLADKRYKNRKLVINLDLIVDQDLDDLLAIARYLGKDKECFIDLYPSDTTSKGIYHRGAFRLTDAPTFNPVQYQLHKNTMTFEET